MKEKIRQMDRKVTKSRMTEVISIGKRILDGSNLLIEGKPIGQEEVQLVRKLIEEISPVDAENYKLHAHSQLVAIFARDFGENLIRSNPDKYARLNLDELEVLALFHDFGRFTTHRFFRNDLVESIELKNIGIRKELLRKLPSLKSYMRKDPNDETEMAETFNKMSTEQKIIETADFCGKRTDNGTGIKTYSEVMEYHKQSRGNYQGTTGIEEVFTSERRKDQNFIEYCAKVYDHLKDWFNLERIDLEEVRRNILEREKNSKIKAVIFDVGNVLINHPDVKVVEAIASAFGVTLDMAQSAYSNSLPDFQAGKESETNFWQKFGQIIQKPIPEDINDLLIRGLETKINPNVKTLIKRIKDKGYILAVLSDTITPHVEAFKKARVYDEFGKVIVSPEIKTTKRSREAFLIAALRLWLPPQACLFIDDKELYIQNAEKMGMHAIHFQSADSLEKDLKRNNVI